MLRIEDLDLPPPSGAIAWLTQEFYVREVQPKLKTIKVREIRLALQVSHPYAALIRTGRRLPHQRHWEVLAKLAKVSDPFVD